MTRKAIPDLDEEPEDLWLLRFWPVTEPEPPRWLARSRPPVFRGNAGWGHVFGYYATDLLFAVWAARDEEDSPTIEALERWGEQHARGAGWLDKPLPQPIHDELDPAEVAVQVSVPAPGLVARLADELMIAVLPKKPSIGVTVSFSDTDVVCRLSVTVPADDLDAALQACRPLFTVFNVVAMEIEPKAPSNSLHGFRAHLLIVSPQTEGADEDVLRLAAVPLLAHFGAERKQILIGHSNSRLVATVLPRKPAGQCPAGVRMCGLSLMLGFDPFEVGQGKLDTTEPYVEPESLLTEHEAEELVSWRRAMVTVRVTIVADVVGADAIDARDMVRELVGRVGRQVLGADNSVEVEEPEITEDGSIRVAALAGCTELEPSEVVAAFAAATGRSGWSAPTVREHDKGQHVSAEWHARDRPERGIIRLDVHAGPGLSLVPDDELP